MALISGNIVDRKLSEEKEGFCSLDFRYPSTFSQMLLGLAVLPVDWTLYEPQGKSQAPERPFNDVQGIRRLTQDHVKRLILERVKSRIGLIL